MTDWAFLSFFLLCLFNLYLPTNIWKEQGELLKVWLGASDALWIPDEIVLIDPNLRLSRQNGMQLYITLTQGQLIGSFSLVLHAVWSNWCSLILWTGDPKDWIFLQIQFLLIYINFLPTINNYCLGCSWWSLHCWG